MNETWVTVIGNVASDVSWRRTPNGGEVANFRLMSTERRYDAESGAWEDGQRVAVGVACWRRLGENVRFCVTKGDPVVVHGKLHVREYELDGVRRSATEIDARSVGLDLGRVCAKVVPRDAAAAGRSVADVTGLPVLEVGTGTAEPDGMLAGWASGGGRGGDPTVGGVDGDDPLDGPDGEIGEPAALAS